MGKYIDGSGLSHFMGILKGAFAAKSDAVSNITRSGTTFTATKADGTTFTFTQQDSTVAKTSTTPKMDGTAAIGTETAYAAGDHVHPSDTTRVPTSRTINGKALSSDVTLYAGDVQLSSSNSDTVADACNDFDERIENKVDKVTGKGLSTNDYTTAEKTKLSNIAAGAEVNQNAFSTITVGGTALEADKKSDTLKIFAGSNITFNVDASSDSFTILATDTKYSQATISKSGLVSWAGSENDGSYLVKATIDSGAIEFADTAITEGDIPNLPASKITSGTFDSARIPSLAISKISGLQDALNVKAPLGSPDFNGTPTAPTAAAGTSTTQIATTAFVQNAVGTATAGALQYKGTVNAESTITGAAYKKGWYYVVATAGTYVGKVCEVGDMLIAKQDKTSTPANDWDAIQSNIEVLSNSEIDTLWAAA